jgi:hypothetical protein
MNMKIKGFVAAGLLLATFGIGLAQYKADTNIFARDEQELRKTERQWAEAMQNEDAATVDKILHSEYVMIDAIGVTASRAEVLDQLRSGTLKFDTFATSDIKPRVFQGGGVLTGRLNTKGKYGDKDISGDYRFVDVFEFRNGAWKAVYTQLTEVKPKK